jgi:hypothetical protein
MASNLWKSLSAAKVAELYTEEVLENQGLFGSFAADAYTMEELLHKRALLQRIGFEPDARMQEADRVILEEGIAPDYSYVAKHGPEWPLRLLEIQAGKYPLDALPPHLRDLAQRLYYSKAPV